LFVDEVPGLFFPPKSGPSREAREVLESDVDFFRRAAIDAVPVWRMAHDAGASIAGAARKLGVDAVQVGTSQRTAVWHLLRGNVLEVPGSRPAGGYAGVDLQLSAPRRRKNPLATVTMKRYH
jgi:hypothetical protein